jgi:hypothetical protein
MILALGAAARHAGWSDTGKCPRDATAAPAVVVQLAGRTAFRARHLIISDVEVRRGFYRPAASDHGIHKPRGLNPQNAPIQLVILRAGIVAFCWPESPTHCESRIPF